MAALHAGHRGAFAEFDELFADKDEIASEFGAPLEWRKNPKSIQIEVHRLDLASQDEAVQFAWFLDEMERFVRVFRPRIESLALDGAGAADAPPTAEAADD